MSTLGLVKLWVKILVAEYTTSEQNMLYLTQTKYSIEIQNFANIKKYWIKKDIFNKNISLKEFIKNILNCNTYQR